VVQKAELTHAFYHDLKDIERFGLMVFFLEVEFIGG
jgi:hypothetical protein